MKSRSITYQVWTERIATTAGLLCIFALCAYLFMLRSVMVNASLHSSIARSASDVSSKLAELEFEYITLKQAVTLEKAQEFGFEFIETPVFVSVDVEDAVSIRK